MLRRTRHRGGLAVKLQRQRVLLLPLETERLVVDVVAPFEVGVEAAFCEGGLLVGRAGARLLDNHRVCGDAARAIRDERPRRCRVGLRADAHSGSAAAKPSSRL